ncbi:hypothetical protein EZV62_013679 [Acer yangbiense]|uniref:Pentacotripeptide-repeat region of PRORP domain-containing protein n=1 Tax=Acer yangbiense TaxID=1000413 RepID=A0A5C7I0N8_9ROSI|nr:hypothetical protein EZV62_013679 [Acer yangbiense]
MASTLLLRFLKKTHKFTTTTAPILTRTCHIHIVTRNNNLYSRIRPLGNTTCSLVPVLDKWVQEGNKLKEIELQRIIRVLRSHKRYSQALQVSEWMSNSDLQFSVSDRAVQLNLIGKVRGLESAESYFNSLGDEYKIDKIYGVLLNCYVREGLVDKSVSHMQEMKDKGFATRALNYNDLMCLYKFSGQLEKVPEVLSDMKKNGISPDSFTYRICMEAYAARSDLSSMERILQEMESQPNITMDWICYSAVTNFYIKAGLKEKALIYLKKIEEMIYKDAVGYNHLICHYASLGNKDEMMRLWDLQKTHCKKHTNRDYITMMGCLVKIDELEETEKLLTEWESSCHCYDFRVPNVILVGYSQKGLIEKAEAILRGKTPVPNSWSIVAAGYLDKHNIEKAFECMKEALAVQAENKSWRPKPSLISSIFYWVLNNRNANEVEAFVRSLKTVIPETTLIKEYIGRKEVDGHLENLKAAEIDGDE